MLRRVEFRPLPEPCADAQPDAAPGMFLDGDGNFCLCDGIMGVIVTPDGGLITQTHVHHADRWNPASCAAISHGITIRTRPANCGDMAEDDRDRLVRFLGALDRAERHEWPRLIADEVTTHGGTYPIDADTFDTRPDAVAELALHGVRAFGATELGAIRNWIVNAKLQTAPRPPRTNPARSHAEEIADLLAGAR